MLREGRLAQLVEHLLYTQGVGGSIPSPPISAVSETVSQLYEFLNDALERPFAPNPTTLRVDVPVVECLSRCAALRFKALFQSLEPHADLSQFNVHLGVRLLDFVHDILLALLDLRC